MTSIAAAPQKCHAAAAAEPELPISYFPFSLFVSRFDLFVT
jgi:hypothetical protein